MMRRGSALILIALCSTAIGCGRERGPREGTIPRDRFIEVNVALRQVNPADPQADSLRAAVLDQQGVSEEDLRSFVEARSDRPLELAEIWGEIHRQLIETPPSAIPGPEQDTPEVNDEVAPYTEHVDRPVDSLLYLRRPATPPAPTSQVR